MKFEQKIVFFEFFIGIFWFFIQKSYKFNFKNYFNVHFKIKKFYFLVVSKSREKNSNFKIFQEKLKFN